MTVFEIWADTGEVIEREPTADELAQRTKDEADATAAAQAAAAAAAIEHAKSLGFTDDMIAAMYPNLWVP